MKTCTVCGLTKESCEFYKRAASPDGFQPLCKICNDAKSKKYREEHPESIKVIQVRHRLNNRESLVSKQRQTRKDKPHLGPEYTKRYEEKNSGNPNFRLKKRLRTRLNHAIREGRAGSAVSDLGCSVETLKAHLQSQFKDGMAWDNWGAGEGKWNVDHIMPLSAFDLTDRQHFLLANHYLNLRPLWAVENIVKRNKIPFELAA